MPITADTLEKAEMLPSYFSSIYSFPSHNVLRPSSSIDPFSSIDFILDPLFNNLKTKSPIGIPNVFIKKCRFTLLAPLRIFFNISQQYQYFAIVKPVIKHSGLSNLPKDKFTYLFFL